MDSSWQHIKDKVAAKQPNSMTELIEAIKHERHKTTVKTLL